MLLMSLTKDSRKLHRIFNELLNMLAKFVYQEEGFHPRQPLLVDMLILNVSV